LWRGVIDCAVQIASRRRGQPIRNLAFTLDADPREMLPELSKLHSQNVLGIEAWNRKIRAAESYRELKLEVEHAFARWGKSAFRVETIFDQPRSVNNIDWIQKPPYELHGEQQVEAGVYHHVLRYRDHVRPILDALRAHGDCGVRAA
jgi:hypothetical protein